MKNKIKLVFLPVIAISILCIALYTFVHWLLFIQLETFQINSEYRSVGGAIGMAGLVSYTLIRNRFKLLQLERKKQGNYIDFYSFLSFIILTAPIVMTQKLMISAAGNIEQIDKVNDIDNNNLKEYYRINQAEIDHDDYFVFTHYESKSRGSKKTMISSYVFPIYSITDTIVNHPVAWFGCQFKKTISKKLKGEQLDQIYEEFLDETYLKTQRIDLSAFNYLSVVEPSEKREEYLRAVQNHSKYKYDLILEGEMEEFETRNNSTIANLKLVSIGVFFVFLIMSLIPKLKSTTPPPNWGLKAYFGFNGGSLSSLIHTLHFSATYIIIINSLIYLGMIAFGYSFFSSDFIQLGALHTESIQQGQYWRFFSYFFLHDGFGHLFYNMVGIFIASLFIELKEGYKPFLLVYVISGVFAGIFSYLYHIEGTLTVGASGAIMGLYGYIFVKMLEPKKDMKTLIYLPLIQILLTLLYGIQEGVDNACHIGGLIMGILIGIFSIIMSFSKTND